MDDEIIIIITIPPTLTAAESEKAGAAQCAAERFDANTLAGLRAARRRINQLIDERFTDAVDEG